MSDNVNILLVDDRPENLLALEAMLEAPGRNLVKADSGERALELLLDTEFAVVLLDVQMPGMDGFETAQLMRGSQRTKYVPIIFVTGISREEQYVFKGYESGAVDYLFKPLDANVVCSKVGIFIELFEQKRALREAHRDLEAAFGALGEKNAQMEEDLRLARNIQQALLPHQDGVFPPSASSGACAIRFHHRYVPVEALGGDFFDLRPVSETEALVFICDVMGHGVQAALMTAVIRGLLDRLREHASDPASLLSEINQSLVRVLAQPFEPVLTTACALVVDTARRCAHIANAGHPSLFHVRRRPEQVVAAVPLETSGAALGLFPECAYKTVTLDLEPGDLLFLYTDGLFEVEGDDGVSLDCEGLEALARKHIALSPGEMLDAVLSDVRAFSRDHVFEDDICLLAVEIL